jgi:hypothetical protein
VVERALRDTCSDCACRGRMCQGSCPLP